MTSDEYSQRDIASGLQGQSAGRSDVEDRGFATDSEIRRAFDVARDERFNRMVREQNTHRRQETEREDRRREKARDEERQDFMVIVVDAVTRRMNELRERMAANYEILREKYGDDVIGGMAATYLTEEELEGLETDDDKLRALSAKFLNEDGEVIPQYEGLTESKYVRDWTELERHEAELNKSTAVPDLDDQLRRMGSVKDISGDHPSEPTGTSHHAGALKFD